MKKRQQNIVVESKLTLPVTALYAIGIWLICGLIQQQWWIQFGCFCLTAYLLMLLNNTNLLIRIYSRMISCTFLALMCCACFLFPSTTNAIIQVCFVGFLLFLFMTYQDKQAAGFSYYAYLVLSMASLAFVQILFAVPILWLLTATQLQSLSWRTWAASILGLLTPYWIGGMLLVWKNDFSMLFDHFSQLTDLHMPSSEVALSTNQTIVLIFTVVLAIIGAIHFIRQNHNEKIRTRLLYAFFIWLEITTVLLIVFQPQLYNNLIGISIILVTPLIAHFLALTSTKITNIAFFVIIALTLIITGYNIWTF